ncbi:MAG: ABC transporter substrate-binding protein [Actinomycetota bacterium]
MTEAAPQRGGPSALPVPDPEQLLPAEQLDRLEELSTDELRARRADCERAEEGVSYARRLLQGRLDILRAELDRRDESGADDLLGSLPSILADGGSRSDALHARATRLRVPPDAGRYESAIDAALGTDPEQVEEQQLDELVPVVDRLAELERELSAIRHALFERIDALRDELAARYKDGRADVQGLLR